MKIIKNILAIVLAILIVLILNLDSFATEIEDNIIVPPDTSIENDNQQNNKEDTSTGNDTESEDFNTGTDEENSSTGDENTGNENTGNENTGNESIGNENIGNENTGNENIENDAPSNNYEEQPNQTENEYEPPVVETPPQEEKPTYNESINNNTVTQTLSDNANLRDLILDIDGLSPEFDKNIIDYYLIIDLSVEKINIEAYPEDINSIVMIDGNTDLQEGENIINITVKAEAGNTKTYTIYVTKTDDVDMVNANLKNLLVKGFNFYPSFKNNIYNYNLTINEKVSQLEIIVEPEIEEATYEIIGNENLLEGDNLIKIIVTAKDGTAKREYKLNVYISSKNVEIQKVNKMPAIVLLSVLGVAILGTTIAISKKH